MKKRCFTIITLVFAIVFCFGGLTSGDELRVPLGGVCQTPVVVGIPKEIKEGETRVGLTPKEVEELTAKGVVVLVEEGAGEKSGIKDRDFKDAGARIVATAKEVWDSADIVKKVKEPLPSEYVYFRRGLTIFTYFHLANPENKELTGELMRKGVTAIPYETVVDEHEKTYLLEPMSRIAGWVAGIWATVYRNTQIHANETFRIKIDSVAEIDEKVELFYSRILEEDNFEKLRASDSDYLSGILAGIQENGPGDVVLLGGGAVSQEAALMSLMLGASSVTITEPNPERLGELDEFFSSRGYDDKVTIINPGEKPEDVKSSLRKADVIISAVYIRSETGSAIAPVLIDEELLEEISRDKKKVVIDVSCDQGGNVVPSFRQKYITRYSAKYETFHSFPVYLDRFGNWRMAIPNIPAAFGEVASPYLNEATQPVLLKLVSGESLEDIMAANLDVKSGIAIKGGELLDIAVADAHGIVRNGV